MAQKKAILIWIFLSASLMMTAYQSPQAQGQTISIQTVEVPATPSSTPLPTPTPKIIGSPVDAAQQLLLALERQDNDYIQSLTCQEQQDDLQQSSGWVIMFPVLSKLPADRIPQLHGFFYGLTVEIVRQDEERARLRVHGPLPVTGQGILFAAMYEVDERWWMVKGDGGWRWCGTSPGEATPTLTPTITTTPLPITRPDLANSSSPSLWKILGALATIVGAVARIYVSIQRKKDKTL